MTRKYFIRIVVWGLLVAVLTLITIYSNQLLIEPLDQQIEDIQSDTERLNFQIRRLQTQINLHHSNRLLTNGAIEKRLPHFNDQTDYDKEIIKQDATQNYLVRPVNLSHGTIKDHTIELNSKPDYLGLSAPIKGIQIHARVSFDEEENIYDFLSCLNTTLRSIYIETLTFDLPTETDVLNPSRPFTYVLEVSYYTFYYSAVE